MMPLVPPLTATDAVGIAEVLLSATTQPVVEPLLPNKVQSPLSPKKKKSTPPSISGLKNSVIPAVQLVVVEPESWRVDEALSLMVIPVNGKLYCSGEVSKPEVPQTVMTPDDGSV